MAKALLHPLGQSVSFGRLSLKAKVLWPMLLASTDDQGRGLADPNVIKWTVCPNVDEIAADDVPGLLDEMVAATDVDDYGMIVLYEDERGRQLYQVVRWWEYQQHTYAQSSRMQAPEGWVDRVRVNNGGRTHKENWEQPGGFMQPRLPESYQGASSELVEGYQGASSELVEGYQGASKGINKTKLNKIKQTTTTGVVVVVEDWEKLYKTNIVANGGELNPKTRQKIGTVFEDAAISFEMWNYAIDQAVLQNRPKLSYVLGVLRNLKSGKTRGTPPAPGGTFR